MKIKIFIPTDGPADHEQTLMAMADGRKDETILVPIEDGYSDCDIAVVFGVGKRAVEASHARGAIIYEHHFRAKKPVVIIERGFIKRDQYYGVALNGLNGIGDFFNDHSPSDRWELLGVELEARTPRAAHMRPPHILVCGQVPWDASVQHTHHEKWCQETVRYCYQNSDFPVVFRPHPSTAQHDYGLGGYTSTNSFDDDVANAHCVVTFNSTTSALAALKGVPIFTLDRGSMAYGLGLQNMTKDNLANPHLNLELREAWAHDIAYAQWTVEEMKTGIVWDRIFKKLG